MQKMGRGPRKGEIVRGTFFTIGEPTMAGSMIEAMKKESEFNYRDGVTNLKFLD